MELNIEEIMKILPHRYPMLLVDRILELKPMEYAKGLKCVTMNEAFFQGHFPNHPIMPGVIICEAMAQVAGVALQFSEETRGKIPMFASMDKVKFRSPITPGDVMITHAQVVKIKGKIAKVNCHCTVNDQIKTEAEFMFYITDNNSN